MEKVETSIKMSQFRNRIVYLYNHIDTEALYSILVNELGDIRDLYADLLKTIDEHKE